MGKIILKPLNVKVFETKFGRTNAGKKQCFDKGVQNSCKKRGRKEIEEKTKASLRVNSKPSTTLLLKFILR